MTDHPTGTREDWLAARLELLDAEKELTRRSDELAGQRQQLPWVRIDRSTASTPRKAARGWRTCSEGAPSSSSTTFAASVGTDAATYTREAPGMSAFALEDDVVYHTYSAYARGVDGLWGMYQWLDRAPKGRNETGQWFRRHDEYD